MGWRQKPAFQTTGVDAQFATKLLSVSPTQRVKKDFNPGHYSDPCSARFDGRAFRGRIRS